MNIRKYLGHSDISHEINIHYWIMNMTNSSLIMVYKKMNKKYS